MSEVITQPMKADNSNSDSNVKIEPCDVSQPPKETAWDRFWNVCCSGCDANNDEYYFSDDSSNEEFGQGQLASNNKQRDGNEISGKEDELPSSNTEPSHGVYRAKESEFGDTQDTTKTESDVIQKAQENKGHAQEIDKHELPSPTNAELHSHAKDNTILEHAQESASHSDTHHAPSHNTADSWHGVDTSHSGHHDNRGDDTACE